MRNNVVIMFFSQEETLKTHQCPVESPLLDGHLSLIVELLSFRTTSERYRIGGHPDGDQLIKVSMGLVFCVDAYLTNYHLNFGSLSFLVNQGLWAAGTDQRSKFLLKLLKLSQGFNDIVIGI